MSLGRARLRNILYILGISEEEMGTGVFVNVLFDFPLK